MILCFPGAWELLPALVLLLEFSLPPHPNPTPLPRVGVTVPQQLWKDCMSAAPQQEIRSMGLLWCHLSYPHLVLVVMVTRALLVQVPYCVGGTCDSKDEGN